MAYLQQIVQEQEAEALEGQIKINFSLETQVFLNYHYGSRNRRKILKTLFRANVFLNNQRTDKTRYLSLKAVEIANAVLHKIVNGKKVLLSHQYLSKITECDTSKQNNNIIAQLANLFDITNHNFLYRDGKVYRHHVEFKLKAAVLEEAKDSGALISEFHWKKISSPINNNKNISNRNIIRSRANFSNSNFNSKNTSTELVENSSVVAKGGSLNSSADTQTLEQAETLQEAQVVETTSPTPATVTPIQTKARPANKRKTKTREEQKQRKTCHVIRNGFLGKGKHLSEVQPYLTDEICEKLRSGSGRAFTNKAIKEITKAIAASDKGAQAFFYHINGLVAYLIPALIREKRDPNKVGGENYYTLAGMTGEDKLWHQREKYLASVEEEAIRHVNPKNHFRAKLANALEHAKAYEFLMAFVNAEMQDNSLKITLNKTIELSERELDTVLFQARAVFNNRNANGDGQYVEAVEYVVNDSFRVAATSQFTDAPLVGLREETELPKGKWGKICAEFVAEFGMELYKHWLKPLSVVEKEAIIDLSTSSGMVRDRIEQNYLSFLGKVAAKFGINKMEIKLWKSNVKL